MIIRYTKKFLAVLLLGLLVSNVSFGGDLAEELKELNKLYQEGVLTKEEFSEAKSKVIGIDKQSQKKQETKKEPKKSEKDFVESSLPACKGNPSRKWSNCQGTYTSPSGEFAGDKYVGEFKNSKEHGQGTYTYANGDKYVGEVKDGLTHGRGTYTWASGSKYVGEFKDGKRHGQGTFTWADGRVEKGIWKNDELVEPN